MKRYLHLLAAIAMAGVVAVPVSAEKKSAKVEKGFVALFDGTTTDQWMNARSGKFPGKGWAIEGDCLKHAAKGGGGDIITRSTYEQFDFRFEWKVAKGANSGVKYFIIRERGSLGHEYQVIDDINHPDGKAAQAGGGVQHVAHSCEGADGEAFSQRQSRADLRAWQR